MQPTGAGGVDTFTPGGSGGQLPAGVWRCYRFWCSLRPTFCGFFCRRRRLGGLGGLNFVAVSVATTDTLIAARTKSPAAVARRGTITGENNRAHIPTHAGMVKGSVKLIHGVGAKSVTQFRAVNGHAHNRLIDAVTVFVAANCPVIGDVS